jgi:hypothetical protein
VLRNAAEFTSLRRKVTVFVGLLEELQNVPMVAAQLALIIEVPTDEFWQDVTLPTQPDQADCIQATPYQSPFTDLDPLGCRGHLR